MNYTVYIDVVDNSNISQSISEQLFQMLKDNNINTVFLDNTLSISEKIKKINDETTNAIVISNQMNNSQVSEIIYSLYYDNQLPLLINDELKTILNIAKYYQLRLPNDTSKDFYEIIRETPDAESIILRYENKANNLVEKIVELLFQALNKYITKSNIYIVQKGDTIYSIAKKMGIKANDIINANNLENYNLSIGQELIIPSSSMTVEDSEIYTVVSGDSLYKIANKFNTTVDEIKRLNNLTSNTLSIGQKLIIKQNDNNNNNTNNETYTVVAGDSLYKIANKFNTTVDEIKRLNNLTSNNLSIGQQLIIKQNISNDNNNNNSNTETYTVIAGDSLYKIANKFNTTVDEIKRLNNLTGNNLSIGQKLIIKKNTTENNKTYTVVSGDSLYKIANKYGTSVDEIKRLNNLTNNNLSIGQTLLIP